MHHATDARVAACGVMQHYSLRLDAPAVRRLGVFSIFSGYFLAFNCVLGAGVEDAFDCEEELGEVAGRPAGKPANKRFNH
jgi:hypothetical protein